MIGSNAPRQHSAKWRGKGRAEVSGDSLPGLIKPSLASTGTAGPSFAMLGIKSCIPDAMPCKNLQRMLSDTTFMVPSWRSYFPYRSAPAGDGTVSLLLVANSKSPFYRMFEGDLQMVSGLHPYPPPPAFLHQGCHDPLFMIHCRKCIGCQYLAGTEELAADGWHKHQHHLLDEGHILQATSLVKPPQPMDMTPPKGRTTIVCVTSPSSTMLLTIDHSALQCTLRFGLSSDSSDCLQVMPHFSARSI